MLRPVIRLELYKKTGGSSDYDAQFEDTPIILESFTNLNSTFGIEQVKDTIKFTMPIINTVGNNTVTPRTFTRDVEIGDLIKLYAYYYPMEGTLSDHNIMVAYIKNFSFNTGQGSGNISFTAYNRSEVLLNNFIFITENQGAKAPNMIVEAATRVKTVNPDNIINVYKDYSGLSTPGVRGAYDQNGTIVPGKTGYVRAYKDAAYNEDGTLKFGETETIPTTQDDDGNFIYYFKDSVFVENYKPFVEHLDSLSTTKHTGDIDKGAYLFYVDEDGNLHWRPKRFINVAEKDGEFLNINEFEETVTSLTKDNNDVVNAVIVNCGTDPNNTGILTFAFNASSIGKNGAKWKYLAKTDIGEGVREAELKSGTRTNEEGITFTGANSPKYIGENNYPSSYDWEVQTSGSDIYGNFNYVGGTSLVSSNPEYREYFRNVCKLLGQEHGDKVVNEGGDPLFKGKIELLQGTNRYTAGDLIAIQVPSLQITQDDDIKLRIKSINHVFQDGIWDTTLNIEEDIDQKLLS